MSRERKSKGIGAALCACHFTLSQRGAMPSRRADFSGALARQVTLPFPREGAVSPVCQESLYGR